jgi:hypothetical protein
MKMMRGVSREKGVGQSCARGVVILFLCLAAWAVRGASQGAKEDLAETLIRAVEHREQLIKNIHSMKAVWRADVFDASRSPGSQRGRERETLLFEGEKQRVESFVSWPGKGEKVVGSVLGADGTRVPLTEQYGERRAITVSDGRMAYSLRPGATGFNRGWHQIVEPSEICGIIAHWAGIQCRFETRAHSWAMRRGVATAERVPGPPERYRVTVKRARTKAGKTLTRVQVFLIAPEYGYALTRFQADGNYPPPGGFVIQYEQFRELVPGIWLPHRYNVWVYGGTNGKLKVVEHTLAVAEEMKLNTDIPDHYFRLPEMK